MPILPLTFPRPVPFPKACLEQAPGAVSRPVNVALPLPLTCSVLSSAASPLLPRSLFLISTSFSASTAPSQGREQLLPLCEVRRMEESGRCALEEKSVSMHFLKFSELGKGGGECP